MYEVNENRISVGVGRKATLRLQRWDCDSRARIASVDALVASEFSYAADVDVSVENNGAHGIGNDKESCRKGGGGVCVKGLMGPVVATIRCYLRTQ